MHTRRVVRVSAPAKINLALHVTGQRPDGYHLLDSLVMLCSPADTLTLREASESRLEVTGPMAGGVPTDLSNLVLKAAGVAGITAQITLEKNLPAAAGIGGGSSDAAACLRGLSLLSGASMPDPEDQLALGADVPVCQHNQLVRMQGIGGDLTLLGPPPKWPVALVNPRVAVPTVRVFSGLRQKQNAPMQGEFPMSGDNRTRLAWLAEQRNDLQPPAIAAEPAIGDVLAALNERPGTLLARMSGSGATCFAIFSDVSTRDAAVSHLRTEQPGWWVMPADRFETGFNPVVLPQDG